jgi:metallo-beta-lactamase family protein
VRATIERIEAFSGHGDYNEMKDYISCQDRSQLKKVFLVHGEYEAQQFYQGKLEEAGFRNISMPEAGTEAQL